MDKDPCKCECKKINTKEVCDSGVIWNPSVCICECNKYCDIYEYLDHKICICRRKMALTEKCEKKNINETLDIISSNDHNKTSDCCIVFIVLFSVFLIINISMAIYVYFFLYLKSKSSNSQYFGCLNINDY